MAHEVTLIPGDGTGPELVEATRRVLEATGVEFDWDEHPAGEDVYADEGTPFPDRTLKSIKRTKVGIKGPTTTSVSGSERIVEAAFEYAKAHGRRKVTAAHKANIMKFSDGLFLDTARKVAERHPETEFEDRIIDNLCNQLVSRPGEYDVIVLPNLYGDIVSDLGAGMIGGLGMAPGANIGTEAAMFEATHGSAPKYKGQNKVNPTALMLSGVLMLRHLEEAEAADRMENGIAAVIRKGEKVTYDLKPSRDDPTAVGTSELPHPAIAERNQ